MAQKRNAPGHKAEGVACKLGGYIDAHSSTEAQVQYLTARLGLSPYRAHIVAPFVFGEVHHG